MINFKTGGPWITRFAPSPTGTLHLGNVRTAVLNFLLARQSGGKFLLRLEDTDRERSTFAAEADILWSLAWLGLTPDEPVRHQSLRLELYTKSAQILMDKNLAYPCFCTEARMELDREEASRKNLPPRYAGRCRDLSPEEQRDQLERCEPHVIRFRGTATEIIEFTDLIKGDMSIPPDAFGDFAAAALKRLAQLTLPWSWTTRTWASISSCAARIIDQHRPPNLAYRAFDYKRPPLPIMV